MLDVVVWVLCGWSIGISVAAALGRVSRRRLAWNGVLGVLAALSGGALLAPAFNMPPEGQFNLGVAAVAVVSSIVLCLIGNAAAWMAGKLQRAARWHAV